MSIPRGNFRGWDKRRVVLSLLIGIIGIILSIVLHELFHLLMHIGEVQSISLFANHHAIAQIMINVPVGYDIEIEELIAYTITVAVQAATIATIWKVNEKKDETFTQTLLGKRRNDLHDLTPLQLIELTHKHNLLRTRPR